MNRERLRAAVFLLLVAGLAAVLAARAVRLARQPEELGGIGGIGGIDERTWFHAAGPVKLAESLGAVRSALPRGAEVWLLFQLGLYTAVYFLTYVSPADHIRSSFTRIAAALVPLGILMIAAPGARRPPRPLV